MFKNIPTLTLQNVSKVESNNSGIFYIETANDTQNAPLHLPYRSEYYGIGIILNGNATIKANLETYNVEKNTILTIAPEVIKQWTFRSDDLSTLSIFFTKSFLSKYCRNPNLLESLSFFDNNAKHTCNYDVDKATFLYRLLKEISVKINSHQLYKNEITASLITVFLYEYLTIYSEELFPATFQQTRSGQITLEFKKLVTQHFSKQRSLKFYADFLFLSPKHLSETVKAETGKPASEWINETIVLEAKILLQEPTLSIANIANQLNFADQSTFGKFFKNHTGISPIAYRQTL